MDLQMKGMAHITLGRGIDGDAIINAILPLRKDLNSLTCEIFTIEGGCYSQTVSFVDEMVRLYSFKFKNLKDGTTYNYRFLDGETEIDPGDGLTSTDLFFTYHRQLNGEAEAVLLSCNGLFDFKGPEKHRHRMWDRLFQNAQIKKPKLLILAGDQYYQDVIEKKWIDKLTDTDFEANYLSCKQDSLANALNHMSHLNYRKLMAQIPSMAQLDDHDITDGVGGRAECFDGTELKPQWRNYIKIQKELFNLLQASRNPSPVSACSFIQDLGQTAIVAFDMRTEKNAAKKQLMEPKSKDLLFEAIRTLPHKNVHILLPVVPLRNSIKFEGMLKSFIQFAGWIATFDMIKTKFPQVAEGLKHITGSADDLDDSLTSDVNKDFFIDLIKLMSEGSKRGVNYSFLSGDIHTGGTTEIYATVDNHRFRIPLIISSPIGYEPMPWFVEVVLREKNEMEFSHNGVILKAVNGRYTTKRNFIFIELNKLFSHPNESVIIFEEAVEGARMLMTKEWLIDGPLAKSEIKTEDAKNPYSEVTV